MGGSSDCPNVEGRVIAGGQFLVCLEQDGHGSMCAKYADHPLVFRLYSMPVVHLRCGTCVNVLLLGWRIDVCTHVVFSARGV